MSRKISVLFILILILSISLNIYFLLNNIFVYNFENAETENNEFSCNQSFVYHAVYDNVTIIPVTESKEESLELPKELIILPGKYNFCGESYEL